MTDTWTFQQLVAECAARIAALPPPKNGQVRAVPDERTVRYYATLGLLDRPVAMRGRTALYNDRHLAQVIAIKRLQSMGRSLAEIQTLWPTLDDVTLTRMSGVDVVGAPVTQAAPREQFWKRAPADAPPASPRYDIPASIRATEATAHVGITIELAPNVSLTIPMPSGVALSPADVRAIRAAAAPLVTELARRQLTPHAR